MSGAAVRFELAGVAESSLDDVAIEGVVDADEVDKGLEEVVVERNSAGAI